MKLDYLIIGQGLAGSTLALQLLQRGNTIMVLDQPSNNRSTAVAAGLFNPLTVRTLALSWRAVDTYPALFDFYPQWEKQLSARFFYPQPLFVPFLSEQEHELWEKRIPSSSKWVEKAYYKAQFEQIYNPLGGLLLNYCGYVDMPKFMEAVRMLLLREQAYAEHFFDENRLVVEDDTIKYESWVAKKVILCTGVHQNKFVRGLPLYPLHGETMTILPEEPLQMIYNRGVFTAPTQGEEICVGATYLREQTEGITDGGQCELDEKLRALLKVGYTKIGSDWGVRPTTRDRKPIIGAYHTKKNVIIFTGLGTRGGSLAPYWSAKLADFLSGKEKIDSEVTIRRFESLYKQI